MESSLLLLAAKLNVGYQVVDRTFVPTQLGWLADIAQRSVIDGKLAPRSSI